MRQMLRIRLFEQQVLEEFQHGRVFGTTHTCIGQEANPIGAVGALRRTDVVFSNHRGHGHYLAHGGSMHALAAELMGRRSGVSGGIGGSQHLYFPGFYSNGVLGGIVPNAVGVALAEKRRHTEAITAVCLGDGTFGEGVVYESLNIASLWNVPILFLVENNRYAQSTPIALNFAGDFVTRFKAFGIEATELDTTDVETVRQHALPAIAYVREECKPCALILHTYRFSPHSKGDDTRDPEEIAQFRERDPIELMRQRISEDEFTGAAQDAGCEVSDAFAKAQADEFLDPRSLPRMRRGLRR